MPKPIKTEDDYKAALTAIDRLMETDPAADSCESDELATWAVLIRDYERQVFPRDLPDPVSALQFVMEQRGLTNRDVAAFIGSRGRVSEVLARKRPLTLSMRRALHSGLGIPAEVLLGPDSISEPVFSDAELGRFPIAAIRRLGWLGDAPDASRDQLLDLLREFLRPLTNTHLAVFTRKTTTRRAQEANDPRALMAWVARVIAVAEGALPTARFSRAAFSADAINELVRLSRSEDGPLKARDFLRERGVVLAIVQHLPRTRLDGAVFFLRQEVPVIGLTLRYDRFDNFWFTLLHELGHLLHDFSDGGTAFFDDLDNSPVDDPREAAANHFAAEALIPTKVWRASAVRETPLAEYALHLAAQLGIHSSIVAGRVRQERKNYRLLRELVQTGTVRHLFERVRAD